MTDYFASVLKITGTNHAYQPDLVPRETKLINLGTKKLTESQANKLANITANCLNNNYFNNTENAQGFLDLFYTAIHPNGKINETDFSELQSNLTNVFSQSLKTSNIYNKQALTDAFQKMIGFNLSSKEQNISLIKTALCILILNLSDTKANPVLKEDILGALLSNSQNTGISTQNSHGTVSVYTYNQFFQQALCQTPQVIGTLHINNFISDFLKNFQQEYQYPEKGFIIQDFAMLQSPVITPTINKGSIQSIDIINDLNINKELSNLSLFYYFNELITKSILIIDSSNAPLDKVSLLIELSNNLMDLIDLLIKKQMISSVELSNMIECSSKIHTGLSFDYKPSKFNSEMIKLLNNWINLLLNIERIPVIKDCFQQNGTNIDCSNSSGKFFSLNLPIQIAFLKYDLAIRDILSDKSSNSYWGRRINSLKKKEEFERNFISYFVNYRTKLKDNYSNGKILLTLYERMMLADFNYELHMEGALNRHDYDGVCGTSFSNKTIQMKRVEELSKNAAQFFFIEYYSAFKKAEILLINNKFNEADLLIKETLNSFKLNSANLLSLYATDQDILKNVSEYGAWIIYLDFINQLMQIHFNIGNNQIGDNFKKVFMAIVSSFTKNIFDYRNTSIYSEYIFRNLQELKIIQADGHLLFPSDLNLIKLKSIMLYDRLENNISKLLKAPINTLLK